LQINLVNGFKAIKSTRARFFMAIRLLTAKSILISRIKTTLMRVLSFPRLATLLSSL
jgi:hypothetical protein